MCCVVDLASVDSDFLAEKLLVVVEDIPKVEAGEHISGRVQCMKRRKRQTPQ